MLKVFIRIIIAVSIISAIISGYICYDTYFEKERVSVFGKELNINIYSDEIIDYLKIDTARMGNGAPKPWFDIWDKSERKKLIEFMKNNNLKIKPGSYSINQADRFEKVLKVLRFEEIN